MGLPRPHLLQGPWTQPTASQQTHRRVPPPTRMNPRPGPTSFHHILCNAQPRPTAPSMNLWPHPTWSHHIPQDPPSHPTRSHHPQHRLTAVSHWVPLPPTWPHSHKGLPGGRNPPPITTAAATPEWGLSPVDRGTSAAALLPTSCRAPRALPHIPGPLLGPEAFDRGEVPEVGSEDGASCPKRPRSCPPKSRLVGRSPVPGQGEPLAADRGPGGRLDAPGPPSLGQPQAPRRLSRAARGCPVTAGGIPLGSEGTL